MKVALVGLVCLLISISCSAQSRCPWLNAATAGGVLGGEVHMSVTPEPPQPQADASCEFTRMQDSKTYSLRITVQTMAVPSKDFAGFVAQCNGATAPLKAIGNEAVLCLTPAHAGEEKIIGRIRKRVFVMTLDRPGHSPGTPKGEPSGEARNLAEQLAGILF